MRQGQRVRGRVITLLMLLTSAAEVTSAQEVVKPTATELAAITERGRMLNEYDQAAWHATDAVQMANPKTVEGQRYIAKEENGKWRVMFGKLNQERSRFGIAYEAEQQANPRVRYLVSADGLRIVEKRQMHKTVIENVPSNKGKAVAGYHTHVLSDVPEDTDVFHTLTQNPPLPEYVATPHFIYEVMTDGRIQIQKEMKAKK